MRVTIACPEALIADANQLALCLGLGSEDAQTYGAAIWQDVAGNRYALASAVVGHRFVAVAAAALPEPPWGADMPAARRAQAALRVIAPTADPEAPTPDPRATPDSIVAVIEEDAAAAVSLMAVVMMAYDRLPEAIRAAVANAPRPLLAGAVLDEWRGAERRGVTPQDFCRWIR